MVMGHGPYREVGWSMVKLLKKPQSEKFLKRAESVLGRSATEGLYAVSPIVIQFRSSPCLSGVSTWAANLR